MCRGCRGICENASPHRLGYARCPDKATNVPRFAANLTLLFTEVPMPARFERAARAGFTAVEMLFPYAWSAEDIKACLDDNRLQLVLHNLPAGDWEGGDRGLACQPDRVAEFRASVAHGIDYARQLGVTQLNCLAGRVPEGVANLHWHPTLVSNLRFAAAKFNKAGLRLLLAPINHFDVPGYCVNRTAQALAILDEVAADNAFVQYDIYHAQRMEGELAATLQQQLPRIDHIQVSDNPGRHEPGTGEINYAFLFRHLDRIGYTSWVGCEYHPAGQTEAGLGWLQALNCLADGA